MKRVMGSIVLAWAFFAGGCIFVAEHHGGDAGREDAGLRMDRIANLKLGLAYERVLEMLGTPDSTSAYPMNGVECRILEYRVESSKEGGGKSQGTVPLVFRDGKLIGWGDAARDKCE